MCTSFRESGGRCRSEPQRLDGSDRNERGRESRRAIESRREVIVKRGNKDVAWVSNRNPACRESVSGPSGETEPGERVWGG